MQFGFPGIGSTFATFGRILCFGFLLQLVFTYFQCLAYGFFLLGSECIAKLYAQRIGYTTASGGLSIAQVSTQSKSNRSSSLPMFTPRSRAAVMSPIVMS